VPEFLKRKLESEYGKDDSRVYATMNKLGAMHGSKETPKGKAMQRKHDRKKRGSKK